MQLKFFINKHLQSTLYKIDFHKYDSDAMNWQEHL